jgi:hypothetical protein
METKGHFHEGYEGGSSLEDFWGIRAKRRFPSGMTNKNGMTNKGSYISDSGMTNKESGLDHAFHQWHRCRSVLIF